MYLLFFRKSEKFFINLEFFKLHVKNIFFFNKKKKIFLIFFQKFLRNSLNKI